MQSVKITSDKDNRLGFKDKLSDKIETALSPPPVEEEPEVIEPEILDKYSTWVPASLAMDAEDTLLPEFKKEESLYLESDLEKRASVKRTILNKVEESLTPIPEIDAVEPEIIEKYSNWAPARISMDPVEVLEPEFKQDVVFVSPNETDKRTSIKRNMLDKVEESLKPAVVEPEPVEIEIIEKYSKWAPARLSVNDNDAPILKPKAEDPIFLHSDLEKRDSIKKKALNKVEEALTPVIDPEVVEPEIIDDYSTWVPARLSVKPSNDLLPEFKKDEPVFIESDQAKRTYIKQSMLNKVEESLTPIVESESIPVEIIEKYSTWSPARISMEPVEVLEPEFKPKSTFVSPHETDKRVSIKQGILNKVEEALKPPTVEPEPAEIEILEKYVNWTPARLSVDSDESLLPEFKSESVFVSPHETDKRVSIKQGILDKVEEALRPPTPEPTLAEIEILEKYSKWVPARLSIGSDESLLPEFKKDEVIIPVQETEKRASIKQNMLNKVEEALTPIIEPTVAEIEILEKYSNWIPARLSIESDESLLPEFKNQEISVSPNETDKRTSIKQNMLNKVEESLTPVIEPEPDEIEILEKYSNWTSARLSIESDESLLPEFKNQEVFVSPHETDKRVSIKQAMLNKVEESLKSPSLEPTLAEIEILEKYANWTPVRLSVKPEDKLLPEFKSEKVIILPKEVEKRSSIKKTMLDKVEDSLKPPAPEQEPVAIEILEKYSNGIPSLLPIKSEGEFFPEFKKEAAVILPNETDKRVSIKKGMFSRVEESLKPLAPEPTLAEIEILEKYANWTPARLEIGPIDQLLPEFKHSEVVVSPHETDKRTTIKQNMLNKVEEALTPAIEEEQINPEILEKYSTWIPARLSMEPLDELDPEFKQEGLVVFPRELEKRVSIKQAMLNKVEESLNPLVPVPDVEPDPVEILDKYTNWTPARLEIEPADGLLPEFKKTTPVISPFEVEKRSEIKGRLLDKVEESLTQPEEIEPVQIEIIDKFSKGIPQRSFEPVDPFFSDNSKVLSPHLVGRDLPQRSDFKDNLFKKVESASITEVDDDSIEIVGYSQRAVPAYGLDFQEIKMHPIPPVPELQETIEDFKPVDEIQPVLVLRLPENFEDLDEKALYGVLIRDPKLQHTSETANLVLDVLAKRTSREVEFEIVANPKPEPRPVKKVKAQTRVIEEFIAETPVSVRESVPSALIPLKELIPFEFVLPIDWENIPLSTLRTDLLNTGATPEQVDAKLASLVSVKAGTSEMFTMVEGPVTKIPEDIKFPEDFYSWKPNYQYLYLTKEKKLTPELSNEIVWDLNQSIEN